jgi:heptose-I-phosphate ethanolaminephosphotransferase
MWSVAVAAAFMMTFYLSMLFFVGDYNLEVWFLLRNVTLFALAAFTVSALPGPSRFYFLLLYLILWIPSVLTASYIQIYKSSMNFNTFYFVWETNTAEAKEFLWDCFRREPLFPVWVAVCTIVPLAAVWRAAREARSLKKSSRKLFRWLGFFVGAALTVMFARRSDVLSFNYATQFYNMWGRYSIEKIYAWNGARISNILVRREGIEASLPPGAEETYVVIIGESASRHHLGLYGYPRDTTPLARERAARDEVVCFNNVSASDIGTLRSLMYALTFRNQNPSSHELQTYSIVDVFNGAGFETYWFSNNAVLGVWDTLLQFLSLNAATRRFSSPRDADLRSMQAGTIHEDASAFKKRNEENLQYDSVLLPWLDEALRDENGKKAIFLHLKGSHSIYRYRYPDAFDHFLDSSEDISVYAAEQPKNVMIVNEYDNSIRYTDYIVDEVIKRLEEKGGRSFVLYFSDHGEHVFDASVNQGRNHNNIDKYMLDVPLFAWFSEEYRRARDIRPFKGWLDRPYSLDDVIHSVIDIAGLKTRLLDPTRSLFSESYVMRARRCPAAGKMYMELPPLDLFNRATGEEERELESRFLRGEGEL